MANASNFKIWQQANGRAAMMGFWFITASYLFTGQLIPGLYLWKTTTLKKQKVGTEQQPLLVVSLHSFHTHSLVTLSLV